MEFEQQQLLLRKIDLERTEIINTDFYRFLYLRNQFDHIRKKRNLNYQILKQ